MPKVKPTSENFFELFQSFSGSVRELISQFDGSTGRKAGIIAANYTKTPAAGLGFSETEGLLGELSDQVNNVNPERLGRIGQLVKSKPRFKTALKRRSAEPRNPCPPWD